MAIAVVYALCLVALSWILFGRPAPKFGSEGTWFYAGIAVLILSASLTEPFFATPAAVVANSVAAIFAVTTFSQDAGQPSGASVATIQSGKFAILIFAGMLIAAAFSAIATKDATGRLQSVSEFLARACRLVGSGRVVFSIVFLASIYAVYSRLPSTLFTLVLAWLIMVIIRPLEFLASRRPRGARDHEQAIGRVIGIRDPGLVEVEVDALADVKAGDTLQVGVAVGSATVLDVGATRVGSWLLVATSSERLPRPGDPVYRTQGDVVDSRVIGPVEPGSTLSEIKVRVPGEQAVLEEGNLLSVLIRGCRVLYQVVAARVREERIGTQVEHRFIEVVGRKIGAWDGVGRRFVQVAWLPGPGSSVTHETVQQAPFASEAIGALPGSSYAIRVDPDLLVTHNTAILGILGIGKTYLAFELIRRVLAAGRRVVVLDITGQYAQHFRELIPEWFERQSVEAIETAIAGHRDQVHQNVHQGGNISDFRLAVHQDLDDFLRSDYRLKIYNPGAFDVTRQDSKLYSGMAALAPLTMVETTRVFAEQLLGIISQSMSDAARVCLVLEEAHSLVPEWNSTTYDGDQRAANGTAKAVLQGRKYGLGVIVVTQRTANVTKTILNQCNTIFAFRIYDATGMEFLRNYVGDSYADVLSGLADRTAVVFGRASSCPNPVLIRVNEHEDMMRGFWANVSSQIPVPRPPRSDDPPGGGDP